MIITMNFTIIMWRNLQTRKYNGTKKFWSKQFGYSIYTHIYTLYSYLEKTINFEVLIFANWSKY